MTRCHSSNEIVGEALEAVQAGGVDQHRDRAELGPNRIECGVDSCAVGHIRDMREIVIRWLQVEYRDVEAVGAQPGDNGLPRCPNLLR